MMRVVAWIAVSLAVASAQESKQTEAKPVPVEASAAIRESLGACRQPEICEVLPDPVKYPELHAKQLELAKNYVGLKEIAGYPCYDFVAECDNDKVRVLLDTLSASTSLRATATRERFWPESLISWNKGKQLRSVAWSAKTNEVVFIDGDNQMRYSLAAEAVKHLRSTMGDMRVMRPDAPEEAAPLLEALKQGAKLTLHEGLPRLPAKDGSDKDALKRRGEWSLDGFQFFKTGIVDRDTGALKDLLLKKDALAAWGGPKACGGFHPDFAITWKVAERDVSLMICFGCHEAKFADPQGDLLFDLPEESYDALQAELEKFKPVPTEASPEK